MVFRRAIVLGFAGLFLLTTVLQMNNSPVANAATEPDVGMTPGTVLVQDVQENKIILGMLSSFATDNLAGYATMHQGDTLKGGTTTVLNGKGDIDTSMYVVNSGKTKMLGTTTTGSNQQAVVDRYLTLPASAASINPTPSTDLNVKDYVGGRELRVEYGDDKKGKAAVVRLEVVSASANSIFNIYPCGQSPDNGGVLYGKKSKVRSTITFANTVTGAICIKGTASALTVKLETYGFMNWAMSGPTILNASLDKNINYNANRQVLLDTKTPNQVVMLNVAARSGSKGFVEAYTFGQANKGMKVLYHDGSTKDYVTFAIHTGNTGKVVLKSNVPTSYSVVMTGFVQTPGSYVAPRQLEDTRNGFPGKGLSLITKKGDYIRPYQVVSMVCDGQVYTNWDSKTFTFKFRHIDPDRPGSIPDENNDQGEVFFKLRDYQLPKNESLSAEGNADKNGIVKIKRAIISEKYKKNVSTFVGEITVYNYYWDYYTRGGEEDGMSKFKVRIDCK